MTGPRRIVCLTEEPTEVLYALGEQERIVGISGFTVRPAIARKQKPKVSAFTSAKIDEILKLRPDFVVGFSDIQADIAAELIRRGVEVWISNHRSVVEILDYVRRLGALVGAGDKASAYADELQRRLQAIERDAASLPRRPKVYFEEWDEPPITGIRWVAELVRIAGGDDIFPERAVEPLAKARILEDARQKAEDGADSAVKAHPTDPGEELVHVRLFRDNGKYKDDVFVAVNGERLQIKRGEDVYIKRKFADVLQQSDMQDTATANMIDRQSSEYAAKASSLGV